MKKIYTFIILIILFMSCHDMANDAPFIDPTPASPLTADEIKSLEVTHVMPYEEALKEVTDFMDQSSTRSSNRTISEVRVIERTTRTRAADSGEIQLADTTLYIFNFANDQGFAIVSADSRSEGLLAFAESGNFTDSITNPGFAIFYSRIEAYQLEAARKDKALKDSLYEQAREKMEKLSPDTRTDTWPVPNLGTWIKETERELPLTTKWHQHSPYNTHIPFENGNSCLAGCTPIAVAQVVAYHKYPAIYVNHYYNWNNLSNDDIAELIYQIGGSMSTNWGNHESSTTRSRVPRAFRALGYKNSGTEYDYSIDLITHSIMGNAPVIIGGHSKRLLFGYDGGHSWLLDGFIKQYRYKVIEADGKILSRTKEERHLVRCNYGWGGNSDGYYLSEVFKTANGAGLIDPDPNKDHWIKPDVPYSTRSNVDGYYQYNITIFPNINPYF